MLADLRFSLRSLRRNPGFTAVAILTLALGIGATTAIYAVVDAVMLRPLPFPGADRLVQVWETTPEGDDFSASDPNYLDFRDRNGTLEGMAAYRAAALSLTGRGEARRLEGMAVTHTLFPLLGAAPILGRTFLPEEDRPGGDRRVALLSHELWQQQFGGDRRIVGSTITLNREPHVVTGVMPAGFAFPGAQLWVPLAPDPARDRDDHWLRIIGRLRPEATVQQASADLARIAAEIGAQHPEIEGWSVRVEGLSASIVGPQFRRSMVVLLAGVGGLLLIGCLNLANLLLARSTARRGELGVRSALGAGRFRIARQLLTESLLLSLSGALLGLLGASWAIGILQSLAPASVPRLDEIRIDWRIAAFALVLGVGTSLVFGLAPALRGSRVELAQGLRQGGRGSTAAHRRTRDALVVGQVAIAMVLLVGAGLLMRSFVALRTAEAGFNPAGVTTVPIEFDDNAYGDGYRRVVALNGIIREIEGIPGVRSAAATAVQPMSGWNLTNDVTPVERAAEAGANGYLQAGWRAVTPGFIETMEIPLLRGRTFTSEDSYDGPRIGLITDALARRLWPGEDAVGKRLYRGGIDGEPMTVIGVVGDYRDVTVEGEPPLVVFLPYNQIAWPSMALVVRSELEPAAVAAAVRARIRTIDPNLPVPAIEPLERTMAAAVALPRIRSVLLAVFAAIALLLAAVGVYGVTAFGVARRTREFGVRLALGATPGEVARMVLRSGALLAATGVALGIAGAWWLSRYLDRLLYGVAATDALTFLGVASLLTAVTLLASYLPGRRASRVDPVVALREE